MTQIANEKPVLKKFYKKVSLTQSDDAPGAFALALDGRIAKTPKRAPLAWAREDLMQAVAQEWDGAQEVIDTSAMPLTRILTTIIDFGDEARQALCDEVLSFLGSDLVCYFAATPAALIERQEKIWTPYLNRWSAHFGAELSVAKGIVAVDQPEEAKKAAQAYLDGLSTPTLFVCRAATELTGSAVLGIALIEGWASAEEIFAASRLDEHFQQERWGIDEEAAMREAAIKRDFLGAAQFLSLCG